MSSKFLLMKVDNTKTCFILLHVKRTSNDLLVGAIWHIDDTSNTHFTHTHTSN